MSALITSCVAVILFLLPVQFLTLPFNMSLVDAWSAFALPMCWVVLVQRRQPVRLPFLPVLLVILLATGVASMLSANPVRGMLVLVRELYLYAWACTLAAVFEASDGRDYRRLLAAWFTAACANGALILAQFVYPPLLTTMNAQLAGFGGALDPYRPSGLWSNSNSAAVFQIMAFVPLTLLALPKRQMILYGVVLLASVVATGSMGAILAVVSGLVVGLVVLAGFFKDWATAVKITVGALLATGLLVGVFLVVASSSPELNARLEAMLYGRGERSASSRFTIWNEGLDVALGEASVWGIGPDRFVERDGHELHNDMLSFLVERGYVGALGLALFAALLLGRSVTVLGVDRSASGRLRVVFPAAAAAFLVESLTHEVFHMRSLWLVLAVQEAVLWRARRRATAAGDGHLIEVIPRAAIE